MSYDFFCILPYIWYGRNNEIVHMNMFTVGNLLFRFYKSVLFYHNIKEFASTNWYTDNEFFHCNSTIHNNYPLIPFNLGSGFFFGPLNAANSIMPLRGGVFGCDNFLRCKSNLNF